MDHPTADGTCVRDYVHVDDIARAHALALHHKIPAGIYNLGSNTGHSVQQVILRATELTDKRPNIHISVARAGDPPSLIASSAKFDMIAGAWRHYSLDDMIQHAWTWYNRK